MKIKIYLFRLTAALTAFVFAIVVYSAFGFFRAQIAAPRPAEIVKESVPVAEIAAPAVEFKAPSENVEPVIVQQSESEFDASGEYYFSGDAPKGFKDFEYLEIVARDYETESEEYAGGIPIAPKGLIQTKSKHKFARIGIGDKQIAFETEKAGGVSYRFTGQFRGEESCLTDEETYDLKGRLVKMKNGKKIAETNAEFVVSCGC